MKRVAWLRIVAALTCCVIGTPALGAEALRLIIPTPRAAAPTATSACSPRKPSKAWASRS